MLGEEEETRVGRTLGVEKGTFDGDGLGLIDGGADGVSLGVIDGRDVGELLEEAEGAAEEMAEGRLDRLGDGTALLSTVGMFLGAAEGGSLGRRVGRYEG